MQSARFICVSGFPAERHVILYECCPDNPYIDVTFYINIRRRKLYYLVNIVAPCLMLAGLTLVTFTIPPDAGEKISFGELSASDTCRAMSVERLSQLLSL